MRESRATDDPRCLSALWMIGYEDEPERSAEICVCEIFGRDVGDESAKIGMGVHLFGDPRITDEFAAETVPIDAREFHVYAAEWTPERVAFSVDGEHVKTVGQSPSYPMQLMLNLYELPADPGDEPAASDRLMEGRKSQNTKLRGLTFHVLLDDSSPALRSERMLMR